MKHQRKIKQIFTPCLFLAVLFCGLIIGLNYNNPNYITNPSENTNNSDPYASVGGYYTVSSPIYINGILEGQNWSDCIYVTGSGTDQDPFILKQLQIITSSQTYCIKIVNTNCTFKIANCSLTNLYTESNSIISIDNCRNGLIYNNSISGIGLESKYGMYGISISCCSNITVSMNFIHDIFYNIALVSSWDCIFDSNTCVGYNNTEFCGSKGIFLQLSKTTKLIKNNCSGNTYGIYFEASNENNLTQNICTNNTSGIHLQFFGNNSIFSNYLTNNTMGISTWNSDNNTICNNTSVKNISGLYIGTSSDGTFVSQNNFTNNSYGIQEGGSNYNIIYDNNLSNSLLVGYFPTWSNFCIFSNNVVDNCPDGILMDNTKESYVTNNTFIKNNNAFRVYFSTFNIFLLNIIRNSSYAAIYVNSGGNNTFTNNTILNSGSGLECANTENNTICNNTLIRNYFGISMTGNSYFNIISGNNCSNSGSSGIYLNSGINNTIENNICYNNIGGINLIAANSNIIRNNILFQNEWGISLSVDSSFNIIKSNIVNNTIYSGIYLNSGKNNSILENDIKNSSVGISSILSHNNTLSNNIISNNNWGISFSSSNETQILNNVIIGNGTQEKGIYIEFSDNCILQKNIVQNYSTGIHLYDSKDDSILENNLIDICGIAIVNVLSTSNVFWNNEKLLLTNATVINAGESIQFNCSVYEDGMNFEWNFGDSEINSTLQNPIHQFFKSGFYLVKLTIISSTNEFSLYSILIEVKSVTNAPTDLRLSYIIGQMHLSWVAPISNNGSTILGYKIYRGTGSGNEVLLCSVGNVTSYIDSNLIYGQTYYYTVAAVNGIGESATSVEINAKALALPAAPINFTITQVNGFFNLSWICPENDSISPITGFKIYRGLDANNLSLLKEVGVVTTYLDTTVNQSITYYYKVIPICALGDGESSTTVSARFDLPPNNVGILVSLGLVGGFALVGMVAIRSNPILKEKLGKGFKTGSDKVKTGVKNVTAKIKAGAKKTSQTAKDKLQNFSKKLKKSKQN